jgi:cell division transport system permease protein
MRWNFFVVEAFRSLRQNLATTLAACVTVLVVMFIAGIGLALGSWLWSYTDKVRNDVTIKAYLKNDATEPQVAALQSRLVQYRDENRIDTFAYVSKDEAWERMRQRLGENSPILDLTLGNPLPAMFEIKAKNPDDTSEIAASLRGMKALQPSRPGQENPDYGSKAADRVLDMAQTIGLVLGGLGIVLTVAAVLLIGNTIRLSIFARRREVEVMKLVGATNWFVRWPFMLEGMICGLIGSVLAVGLLLVSYRSLLENRFDDAFSSNSDVGALEFQVLAVILLVAGVALGAAGSGLTMRRFLRV